MFGNLTKHTDRPDPADLEAAGIPYRDASDRVADFHALRHSYITALAMSNAPVKVVQSLARHSTPTLTLGIYAHVGLYDQTSRPGRSSRPDRHRPEAEAATLAATGTDGDPSANCLPYIFPTEGTERGGTCRSLAEVTR